MAIYGQKSHIWPYGLMVLRQTDRKKEKTKAVVAVLCADTAEVEVEVEVITLEDEDEVGGDPRDSVWYHCSVAER